MSRHIGGICTQHGQEDWEAIHIGLTFGQQSQPWKIEFLLTKSYVSYGGQLILIKAFQIGFKSPKFKISNYTKWREISYKSTYKVKFTFKIPKIHYKDYNKNPKFDLQLTFGQLLTFGQIICQS